jgi:hypothetical protein
MRYDKLDDTSPKLTFSPFHTGAAAKIFIINHLDQIYGPGKAARYGIIWVESAGITSLRAPTFDSDGLGTSIVVELHGAIPPQQQQTDIADETLHNIDDVVREFYSLIGRNLHEYSKYVNTQESNYKEKFFKDYGADPNSVSTNSSLAKLAVVQAEIKVRDVWRDAERYFDKHPIISDDVAEISAAIGLIGASAIILALFPEELTATAALLGTAAVITFVSSVGILAASYQDRLFRTVGRRAALLNHPATAQIDAFRTSQYESSAFYRRSELLAPILSLPGIIGDSVVSVGEFSVTRNALASARQDMSDAQVALSVAKNNAFYAKMSDGTLNKALDNMTHAPLNKEASNQLSQVINRENTDPVLRSPRDALDRRVKITSHKLRIATDRLTEAENSMKRTVLNMTALPHFQKLSRPVLGISHVPAIPASFDVPSLLDTIITTPSTLESLYPPNKTFHFRNLDFNHAMKKNRMTPIYITYSFFVSTKTGQPGA